LSDIFSFDIFSFDISSGYRFLLPRAIFEVREGVAHFFRLRFSAVKSHVLILSKNWFGYNFGDFFTHFTRILPGLLVKVPPLKA
jgi:hypothetical protein